MARKPSRSAARIMSVGAGTLIVIVFCYELLVLLEVLASNAGTSRPCVSLGVFDPVEMQCQSTLYQGFQRNWTQCASGREGNYSVRRCNNPSNNGPSGGRSRRCVSTGLVRVNLTWPESPQLGSPRFVGNDNSSIFKCYPLSDEDIWRSRRAVPGDLTRLRALIERARAGAEIRVAVLGGSVTNGGACMSPVFPFRARKGRFGACSWSNRFVMWLRQHTRNANIYLFSFGTRFFKPNLVP